MKSQWALQDARNRLSQVVEQAAAGNPQTITVRGQAKAVVIGVEEYRRLIQPPGTFVEFLRASPWYGIDLDLERSREPGRAAVLE